MENELVIVFTELYQWDIGIYTLRQWLVPHTTSNNIIQLTNCFNGYKLTDLTDLLQLITKLSFIPFIPPQTQ